jgi:hypothetical protein
MAPLLPELSTLPTGLLLDRELVAWHDSTPYFPDVCDDGPHTNRSMRLSCVDRANMRAFRLRALTNEGQ